MKKRILSLCLCAVLLLSSAFFLSSCSKETDDGIIINKRIVDVDLTGYSIVTGTELTEKGNQHVQDFAKDLSGLIGAEVSVSAEAETVEVKTKAPEILIGMTHRLETVKVLQKIKGAGWAVQAFKNKIVIVGTTPYLTRSMVYKSR